MAINTSKKMKSIKQKKIDFVMEEFKQGKLKSSSGKLVTGFEQALAIALSEAENIKGV